MWKGKIRSKFSDALMHSTNGFYSVAIRTPLMLHAKCPKLFFSLLHHNSELIIDRKWMTASSTFSLSLGLKQEIRMRNISLCAQTCARFSVLVRIPHHLDMIILQFTIRNART